MRACLFVAEKILAGSSLSNGRLIIGPAGAGIGAT